MMSGEVKEITDEFFKSDKYYRLDTGKVKAPAASQTTARPTEETVRKSNTTTNATEVREGETLTFESDDDSVER